MKTTVKDNKVYLSLDEIKNQIFTLIAYPNVYEIFTPKEFSDNLWILTYFYFESFEKILRNEEQVFLRPRKFESSDYLSNLMTNNKKCSKQEMKDIASMFKNRFYFDCLVLEKRLQRAKLEISI